MALRPNGAEPRGTLRTLLDGLYLWSGRLSACFLVAICAVVTAQILGNLLDRLMIILIGAPIGIIIPAYSDFAGFFLAASTFLAMAYTLTNGEQIRVRVLLSRVPETYQRWVEVWCVAFSVLLVSIATWYGIVLVHESWMFGDVVPGMVAIPLWIPQSAMVLGLVILLIALIDALVVLLRGGEPSYNAKKELDPTGHLPEV